MVHVMKVNGLSEHRFVKAVVYKFGQMDQCMKAIGWITRPTAKADSSMLMVMSMTVTGKMIKLTASEYTAIWMVLAILANGKRTNNMERDLKHGLMEQVTRDST